MNEYTGGTIIPRGLWESVEARELLRWELDREPTDLEVFQLVLSFGSWVSRQQGKRPGFEKLSTRRRLDLYKKSNTMFTISKDFDFSASHQLTHLPEGHPCARLHGHNYKVRLTLQSQYLDDRGFVVDYNELDPFKEWIDSHLDHRHLNEVFDFAPTAEMIARRLYFEASKVSDKVISVSVSETGKTWATYQSM